MSARMWRSRAGCRPRVYKSTATWWADVVRADGRYLCAFFDTHAEALAKADEYAAMNKEVSA